MLTQGFQLLAGVLAVFVPGLALLWVLGVRSVLWFAGMAVPVTFGVLVVASCVTGVTGLPFTAYTVAGVLVVLLAVTYGIRRRLRKPATEAATTEPPEGSLTGPALTGANVLGILAVLGAIGISVRTWFNGLGHSWATANQEHDPITHSLLAAYIHFTGKAAPWQLEPLNVVTGKPVAFYPPGFPQLSSVITDLIGGSPMTGMNVATVVTLAIAWPLSAAALAAAVSRIVGCNKGWTYLAGGIAALVAAGLYRPAVAFAHDSGVLPQAISIVLVPGVVAAMLTIRRRQWSATVALAFAAGGMIAVHPSSIVSLACTAVAALIGLLFTKSGRERLRELALPLLVPVAAAVVVLIPVTILVLAKGSGIGRDTASITPQTWGSAVDNTVWLTYSGYLDPSNQLRQFVIGAVALAAAVVIIAFRRGWPVLVPWAFWVVVNILFQLSPDGIVGDVVGRAFYKVFTRLNAHTYVMIPALIAVGAVLLAAAALHLLRSWRLAPIAVLAAVVLVGVAYGGFVLPGYVHRNTEALASRYSQPEFDRYDQADYDAVRWLHDHARPGEMIMNNGNDGSTLAYVEYGLPVVNVTAVGAGATPYTIALLAKFNTYPQDPQIRQLLVEHDVKWVYVDTHAPLIGVSPTSWVGKTTYTVAPGLQDVAGLPGMSLAFHSGHVTVYRLDLP